MRVALLISLGFMVMQSAYCQCAYSTTNIALAPVSISTTIPAGAGSNKTYSPTTINKRLKTFRRCTIGGAVLTAVGGGLFTAGCILIAPWPRRYNTAVTDGHKRSGNWASFAVICSSFPEICFGVPLLTVGVTQTHKWQKRKNAITMQAGIMSNAPLGIALGF